MKNILGALSALVVVCGAPVAMASEPIRVVVAGQDNIDPRARALSARVIELTTPDLEKQLLAYVATMSANLGLAEIDTAMAAWFEKNAGPTMIPYMRVMMGEMETLYAQQLTIAELESMVAFYDTPMGREIARKQVQLGLEMSGPIERMQTGYVVELMQSFCAQFDCNGTGAVAASAGKSGRR